MKAAICGAMRPPAGITIEFPGQGRTAGAHSQGSAMPHSHREYRMGRPVAFSASRIAVYLHPATIGNGSMQSSATSRMLAVIAS
jgi:hypothetical protein